MTAWFYNHIRRIYVANDTDILIFGSFFPFLNLNYLNELKNKNKNLKDFN